MQRSSGMRTSRSGRSAPPSTATWVCSVKSQCSDMPASSTTRRSVISPQRPRTSGRRKAVDRLRVSRCRRSCTFTRFSICPDSLPEVSRRSRSSACDCSSCLASACFNGSTSCLMASSRATREAAADSWLRPKISFASLMNVSLLASSAARELLSMASRTCASLWRSSSALRASACSSVASRALASANCARRDSARRPASSAPSR